MKTQRVLSQRVAKVAPGLIAFFFTALLGIALYSLFTYRTQTQKSVLQTELERLSGIFAKINQTAGILSFDYDQNWINFLHVHKGGFSGSEVGSLNLVHPDEWEGPYMDDNPTYQGIEYQVVKTKNGLYIMPGPGVQLPNGNVIGKDIIIDSETDMRLMLEPGGLLESKDTIFAVPVQKESIPREKAAIVKALES